MYKPKVVIHSVLVDNIDIESKILSDINAKITFVPNDDINLFFKEIKDADGIIIADREITSKDVDNLEKCKVIARQGIGFNNIDLTNTKDKDIIVTNVPDYCLDEVSDFAMSLMLSMLRHIPTYDRHVREGMWDIKSIITKSKFPAMRRLNTQVLGIVGFGRIARELSKKAKVFGFKILAYDPYINNEIAEEHGVVLTDFETLIKESDVISIHSPLTPETEHIFNINTFKKMKNTSILVNTSRGPLVKEKDLIIALRDKIIAGAAIDVTEVEPPEANSELLKLENLIITPHAAFFTEDSYIELRKRAAEEVVRILSGEDAQNRVNK